MLDKAIEHGKEKRKPYHGAKAIDRTCRNHGTCTWCESNRKHKFRDKHPQNESDNWEDEASGNALDNDISKREKHFK